MPTGLLFYIEKIEEFQDEIRGNLPEGVYLQYQDCGYVRTLVDEIADPEESLAKHALALLSNSTEKWSGIFRGKTMKTKILIAAVALGWLDEAKNTLTIADAFLTSDNDDTKKVLMSLVLQFVRYKKTSTPS